MTFEAKAPSSDPVINASKAASLRSAPVQLREGVHTFLSLAKLNPDLHPAVLAAILARPACERRSLLEAARASTESKLSGCSPEQGKQGKQAASPADTLSSDSDEVWEDAVEDLDCAAKKQQQDHAVDMATVVVGDKVDDGELERLERDAADFQRAWQETRQLGAWTRYTECRKKLAELRERAKRARNIDEERTQQEAKWSQLEALREVHERRLAELNRRRERLRLSRQYHEQTRLHHAQLAQSQLQQQLRDLEQRQQARRLQHLQRMQQLMAELAEERADKQPLRRSASEPSTTSPSPASSASSRATAGSAAQDDVFTHMWDDFSHWEKMVNDDKENADPADATPRPAKACSSACSAVAFGNPPDLIPVIPVMPSSAAGAGVWGQKSVGGNQHGNPHYGRRHSVAVDGFEERKKWFEEALLSWHAQGDEEDFGTSSLTSSARPRMDAIGDGRSQRRDASPWHTVPWHTVPWHHAAWSAWTGPATSTY
ncbi:inner centromere protein-like [Thrips palmi]|uniref:Inner centromere protein-like n=1 Tax=Thrips palmi TaxID=161013 RepID=A0A6P8ZMS6_THRPL|nr:inner centromere protein-like [Thrips palmi]